MSSRATRITTGDEANYNAYSGCFGKEQLSDQGLAMNAILRELRSQAIPSESALLLSRVIMRAFRRLEELLPVTKNTLECVRLNAGVLGMPERLFKLQRS